MKRSIAIGLVGLALAACGTGPSAPQARVKRQVATAQAHHEYPGPTRTQQAVGGSPMGAEAVLAFATEYVNWNSQTVSSDMRTLAARSIGQARSTMELAAAQTSRDYELQRDGIANRGQVEAVAPLTGQANQWVVVTREQTTAANSTAYQGLKPAWHVTVATVVELSPGRWVVSGWQPES